MAINFLSGIDVDNGVLYTDTANNRVGINQTSPIGAVHILGPNTNPAMTTSALVVEQGDGAKILIDGNDIDAAAGMLYLNDYSTNDVVFGGQIRVGGGGSPVGNSWFANGNVGIGTTSPSEKLDVVGSAQITNDIYLGRYIFHDGDTNTWLGFPLADTISFRTSGSDRMYITSAGNVGIGTTSPQGLLHVSSGTSGDAVVIIEADTDNNNENDNPQLQFKQDAGGIVAKAGLIGDPGQIFTNSLGNGTYFGTDSNASVQFYTNGAAALTIREDGDVGIGTNSPVDKLDVRGTARITSPQANDWIVLAQNYATGAPSGFWDSNGNVQLYLRDSSSNTNVLIKPDSSSYFNGGNVGIGTTSPNEKLEVAGTVRITGNGLDVGYNNNGTNFIQVGNGRTTNGYAYIDLVGDSTYTDYGLRVIRGNGGANTTSEIIHRGTGIFNINATQAAPMTFRTSNIERIRITSSGNVGIGTTSPALKLEVEGGDALLQLSTTSSTGNPYMTFSQAGTRRSFIQHRDSGDNLKIASEYGSISLFTGTGGTETERVTILSGGNVGIGTTSPTSPLHIQKTLSGGQVMAYFDGTVGPSTYGALGVRVDNIDYGTGMRFYRSGIYDSGAIGFINGTSIVGSININTSSTSYNTTSDYRLKENLTEITDGIDRIKQLKPKRFNFIGDTSIVDGFIAHEAKQVVPEAVTGEKDEVLPNGDPVYQGIDQAKIVPLLTAALQEAIAKIEVLENRLQILENK